MDRESWSSCPWLRTACRNMMSVERYLRVLGSGNDALLRGD
jgi:hypothetical protein